MSNLIDMIFQKLNESGLPDIPITDQNRQQIEELIDEFVGKLLEFQESQEPAVELYTELDLKLMTVKQLKKLLRDNGLKVPKLKAEMIKVLLENNIGKDNLIHPEDKKEIGKTEEEIPLPLGIENLPNEMIYELCQNMDNLTLSRFIQANSRHKALCQEILDKRKEAYLKKKEEAKKIWKLVFFTGSYVELYKKNKKVPGYPIDKIIDNVALDDEYDPYNHRARRTYIYSVIDPNDVIPIVFSSAKRAKEFMKEFGLSPDEYKTDWFFERNHLQVQFFVDKQRMETESP